MRAFNQGAYFRVAVSEPEVYAFAQRWPCSGLPSCGISFTFKRENGDLVDLFPEHVDSDGSALGALADDAKAYGMRRRAKGGQS
jgi:hypothetical protein